VLNFGLPPLSGAQASTLDVATLEQNVRQAVLRFEPRILPESLRVRALETVSVLDTHNQIELEITGLLWSQPVPLEVMIRTELDLETGQVHVRDTQRAMS
jgi:type VI secretion system protein ImpF